LAEGYQTFVLYLGLSINIIRTSIKTNVVPQSGVIDNAWRRGLTADFSLTYEVRMVRVMRSDGGDAVAG
jgi:hypothetical protein